VHGWVIMVRIRGKRACASWPACWRRDGGLQAWTTIARWTVTARNELNPRVPPDKAGAADAGAEPAHTRRRRGRWPGRRRAGCARSGLVLTGQIACPRCLGRLWCGAGSRRGSGRVAAGTDESGAGRRRWRVRHLAAGAPGTLCGKRHRTTRARTDPDTSTTTKRSGACQPNARTRGRTNKPCPGGTVALAAFASLHRRRAARGGISSTHVAGSCPAGARWVGRILFTGGWRLSKHPGLCSCLHWRHLALRPISITCNGLSSTGVPYTGSGDPSGMAGRACRRPTRC
jgi:hypothetical protein